VTTVLGLFAKAPLPGQVKTRLAACTSPEWAAQVAAAFLSDMIERLAAVADQRYLVFAPKEARAVFEERSDGRYRVEPQAEGNLGRRMAGFIDNRLREGAERIVLLGADSPTVPTAFVDEAFEQLKLVNVVLGPALDGGYYLLGCARRLPPIFDGIAWGEQSVLAETVARLSDPSWRVALLPPWYDVDTLDDWQMLRGHLVAMRRAGIDAGAPRTERLAMADHS
jgi:rSAM/selenodomain-associated transferase 1